MKAGEAQPSGAPSNRVGQTEAGAQSIDGGGLAAGESRLGRPKARLCAMMSLLWIFPSAGALFILTPGFLNWFQAGSFREGIQAIAFEQWIALVILLAHLVLAGLAWHYRRSEPLREEPGQEPNSDLDPRQRR